MKRDETTGFERPIGENTIGESRRRFLKAGVGVAGGGALAPLVSAAPVPSARKEAELRERIERESRNPRGRILLKGGTIISMDPKVGDFLKGDLLIEGSKIVDVGRELKAQALVVDASGTVMIPGFVDTHRHSMGVYWFLESLSQLPFPAPYADSGSKARQLVLGKLEPADVYAMSYASAMACVNAGVTCMIDLWETEASMEQAEAAIQALVDSGVRGVHGYGSSAWGSPYLPQEVDRIRQKYFSNTDQLTTLMMVINIRAPEEIAIGKLKFARERGIRIVMEGNDSPKEGRLIENLGKAGHFRPDMTFVHCTDISDTAWRMIADAGASVSLATFSEPLIGTATAVPAIQQALDHGIRPSLSADILQFTDFFRIMHMALDFQRSQAFGRRYAGDKNPPEPLTLRDVLEFATVQGAKGNGLLGKTGTLTPGKEADVVLVRADDVNTVTSPTALNAVVLAADVSNVDTVIIGGKVKKFRRQLMNTDGERAVQLFRQSREKLFARAGYTLDFLK